MGLEPVRDAYSSISEQYLGLFDNGWQAHEDDTALVRRHLTELPGPVLDLGCGPGHWTAYLHSLGANVTGVDMVPEFITHAGATHRGPEFRLGSMTELDIPAHSVAGILAWYSTIHLKPAELDRVLAEFRRLMTSTGMLVIGLFDSDDGVAGFDHKVVTAYRWPVDLFTQHMAKAGFIAVQRLQRQSPDRVECHPNVTPNLTKVVPGRCFSRSAARVSADRSLPPNLGPCSSCPSQRSCPARWRFAPGMVACISGGHGERDRHHQRVVVRAPLR